MKTGQKKSIWEIPQWKNGRSKTLWLVQLALMTALSIVMAEFFNVKVIKNVIELSFGFLPLAVTGMLFGPIPGMMVGAVSDILGALLSGAEFFPGFTLTAILEGLFYGLFLYRENANWKHVLIAQALVSVICFAGLNSLWVYLMGYGRSAGYLWTRILVNIVAYPIYSGIILAVQHYRKPLEQAIR